MLLTRSDEVETLIHEVREVGETYIDLETRGLKSRDPGSLVVGGAVKPKGRPARYLSIHHRDSVNLPEAALVDTINAACEGHVRNHNLWGFDVPMWRDRLGAKTPAADRSRDTMVSMNLENENVRHGLKPWAKRVFGHAAVAAEAELTDWMLRHGYDPKADIWRAPADKIAPYACDDVVLAERVDMKLEERLAQLGIADLAAEYHRYRALLARMEAHGLRYDHALADELRAEAERREGECKLVITRAGLALPSSPKPAADWIESPDTQKWRLKMLKNSGDDRAAMLLEYRMWAKARGFYEGYLKFGDGELLRPRFRLIRTGRLSCADPNLHSTPHWSEIYKCKDVFVAPEGHFLILADWSQAEMRLGCHYSPDPLLTKYLTEGLDVHTMVAEELAIPRNPAKNVNYGAAYGIGPIKLAKMLGCPVPKAREWLGKYHDRFPGPKELYRKAERLAREQGWIRMWDGRYRRFARGQGSGARGGMNSPHTGSNSLLQGGVGGMSRQAMLALEDFTYSSGGQMWIQIHDAIMFCFPESMRRPETFRTIRAAMEDFTFKVPIPVDFKVGRSWGSLTKVEE